MHLIFSSDASSVASAASSADAAVATDEVAVGNLSWSLMTELQLHPTTHW